MKLVVLVCVLVISFFTFSVNCGTFSIRFATTAVDQVIAFDISVNGLVTSFTSVQVTNAGTEWINFSANPTDSLSVEMIDWTELPFGLYYTINNRADGTGSQIYDSRSNTFTPVNTCAGPGVCSVKLTGVNFQNSRANVYVNGQVVITNFDGTFQFFDVYPQSSIRIDFTYDSSTQDVYYFLETDVYNNWYYNSYGQNTLIYQVPRSPTGGLLYPITQGQSDIFAILIGAGKENLLWFPRE